MNSPKIPPFIFKKLLNTSSTDHNHKQNLLSQDVTDLLAEVEATVNPALTTTTPTNPCSHNNSNSRTISMDGQICQQQQLVSDLKLLWVQWAKVIKVVYIYLIQHEIFDLGTDGGPCATAAQSSTSNTSIVCQSPSSSNISPRNSENHEKRSAAIIASESRASNHNLADQPLSRKEDRNTPVSAQSTSATPNWNLANEYFSTNSMSSTWVEAGKTYSQKKAKKLLSWPLCEIKFE